MSNKTTTAGNKVAKGQKWDWRRHDGSMGCAEAEIRYVGTIEGEYILDDPVMGIIVASRDELKKLVVHQCGHVLEAGWEYSEDRPPTNDLTGRYNEGWECVNHIDQSELSGQPNLYRRPIAQASEPTKREELRDVTDWDKHLATNLDEPSEQTPATPSHAEKVIAVAAAVEQTQEWESCDHCGAELIDMCLRCGAPVCCETCCRKENNPDAVQVGEPDRSEQTPAEAQKLTPAPASKLPKWKECRLRVENSDAIDARIAEGGFGYEEDGHYANELHRFIFEYDDSDSYKSSWFMHRLEKLIDFVKKEATAQKPQKQTPAEAHGLYWNDADRFLVEIPNATERVHHFENGSKQTWKLDAEACDILKYSPWRKVRRDSEEATRILGPVPFTREDVEESGVDVFKELAKLEARLDKLEAGEVAK